MKTLIIGKGFVGNALAEIMPDAIHISKYDVNYTISQHLEDFIVEHGVTTIINCSGYTGVPNVDACETNKESCYFYNVIVPHIIQKIAIRYDINMIHIGSGCIYDGYDKEYVETDIPNFGIFSDRSSFYSKTKHISEMVLESDNVAIVRLRIPFDWKSSKKNYIDKLLGYDKLIDFKNSKTDLRKLCQFIKQLSTDFKSGAFNAVHSKPLYTREFIKIINEYGYNNPSWELVGYTQIPIIANRSNCVLSNNKVVAYGFDFGDEETSLRIALEHRK
jgi:UDP-glucose 4,6-dehydratase